MCDGCCCGTDRKHPDVDHAGIRERIDAAAVSAGGRSRVVGCVGACDHSNVVIVRPAGISTDRVWVGGVLDEEIVDRLCDWIAAGAVAPAPAAVAARVFSSGSSPPSVSVALSGLQA
jgi:(2Fe-2S) ferredoxin